MDTPLVTASATDVRALIAQLVLAPPPERRVIGSITLSDHQADAVARIRTILATNRGAFLCDVVGSGKTYIACAVARAFENAVVIAPAALRTMWAAALTATETRARFVTTESMSRKAPCLDQAGCVVVDEAHHFRNPRTRRYRALAKLASRRVILLATATPVHNSRRDLESLGALFLGSRAGALSDVELAGLIVRRDKNRVSRAIAIPRTLPTEWLAVGDDADTVGAVTRLPAPVPFRDAGDAAQLVAHGLIRQWASSEAALADAIKRRLARGYSLEASLEGGEYPTERELDSWLAADDTVQLGFPGLLGPEARSSDHELLASVRAHTAALRTLAARSQAGDLDKRRADHLRQLTRRFPGERIVAFASYDATVTELFRRLNHLGHVAALTSRGGRVAGGRLPREEIILQFSPDRGLLSPAERIDMLLTTDLLSEGINLQAASIVVHLDIPWTPARMDQRVGRVARAGSSHPLVRVFAFRPPDSAETALRSTAILAAKSAIAARTRSAPELGEAIRAQLERWRTVPAPPLKATLVVGRARSTEPGFIAVLESDARPIILVSDSGAPSTLLSDVYRIVSSAGGDSAVLDETSAHDAIARIRDWIRDSEATEAAGLNEASSLRNRRRLFARIDSLSARMAPHERVSHAGLVLRARHAAASVQGAWGEEEVAGLAKSARADYEWLERLTAIEAGNVELGASRNIRIRALLLLAGPTPAPAS